MASTAFMPTDDRPRRGRARTTAPTGIRGVVVLEPDIGRHRELLTGYRSAGLDITISGDAFRAVLLVAEHRPDALIMSAAVPLTDAVRTVSVLRAEFTVPTIVAIDTTDAEQFAPVILAGALPMNASTTCIEAVVHALSQLPAPRRDHARVTVGALVLDPTGNQAVLAGQRLELSPTEFSVLHVLAEHADDVVSTQVLLRRCWPGRDVTNATLATVVARLRQHLSNSAGAIRTVRGFGYVLDSAALTR